MSPELKKYLFKHSEVVYNKIIHNGKVVIKGFYIKDNIVHAVFLSGADKMIESIPDVYEFCDFMNELIK